MPAFPLTQPDAGRGKHSASPLPALFPSEPGVVFPMYPVLADLADFGAKQVYPTHSSHPLLAEGLTLFDATGRRRVLVANLTRDPQDLKIKSGTCNARVRRRRSTVSTARGWA